MAEDFDVAILGCGITGMTLAQRCVEEGRSVVLIDDYLVPGGNHITHIIDGLEFDIGTIYFHSTDLQFKNFPVLKDHIVQYKVEHKKINHSGRVTKFPLSIREDFPGLKLGLLPLSAAEALLRRIFYGHGPNADTWIRSRIGSFAYAESGLADYIERLLGCAPSDADLDFAKSRLGWLERSAQIGTQIRRMQKRDRSNVMRDKSVVRSPGGFGLYYTHILETLKENGVKVELGAGLKKIEMYGSGTKSVSGKFGNYSAKRLISTLPFVKSANLSGVEIPEIEHVTLLSIFIEADQKLSVDGSVIYNFDRAGKWKRLTVHSNFYNPDSGRIGLTVEVPLSDSKIDPTPEFHFAAFQAHAVSCGIVDGPLRLLGASHLPYAYPVLKTGYRQKKDTTMLALEASGIEGAGRHGSMQYLPSSSGAIAAAHKFYDQSESRK